MATCTDVKKEILRSCVDIIRSKMFYGHIIQQFSKLYYPAEKSPIPTMGVGKKDGDFLIKFYINEGFVKDIFEKAETLEDAYRQLNGVVEHEILHCVLFHLPMKFTDRIRGNVAVDLSANSYLSKNNLPFGSMFPADFKLEEKKDAFWYYTHLKDNKHYKKLMKEGKLPAGLTEIGNEDRDCSNKDSGLVGSHAMWDAIQKDPLMNELLKDVVNKAEKLCNKQYGDIPSDLMEQLEGLFERKKALVPWNKALRMFAASACESNLDYTMKRVSKRFGSRPGTKKEDVLNLAIGVDTSGSISLKQLEIFFNEIRWIWKNGAMITVYEADADIQKVYKFRGKFKGKVHGRGGTDLEPVLKEVEGKYDALIYFTDFYAPKIETRYHIPILWVLTNDMEKESFPYEWGKHISIDIEDQY